MAYDWLTTSPSANQEPWHNSMLVNINFNMDISPGLAIHISAWYLCVRVCGVECTHPFNNWNTYSDIGHIFAGSHTCRDSAETPLHSFIPSIRMPQLHWSAHTIRRGESQMEVYTFPHGLTPDRQLEGRHHYTMAILYQKYIRHMSNTLWADTHFYKRSCNPN